MFDGQGLIGDADQGGKQFNLRGLSDFEELNGLAGRSVAHKKKSQQGSRTV